MSRAMLKTFFNGALLGAREKGEELSYVSRLWVRSSVTKAFSAEQRLLDRFLGAFKCSKVYVELERYGVQYINTYSLNNNTTTGGKGVQLSSSPTALAVALGCSTTF